MKEFSPRMMAWFTPSMIASTEFLVSRLEELAAEYDAANGDLKTKRFDEIMAESDKIQAELWRRHVSNENKSEN
jgi:hypothetical protein